MGNKVCETADSARTPRHSQTLEGRDVRNKVGVRLGKQTAIYKIITKTATNQKNDLRRRHKTTWTVLNSVWISRRLTIKSAKIRSWGYFLFSVWRAVHQAIIIMQILIIINIGISAQCWLSPGSAVRVRTKWFCSRCSEILRLTAD